MGDPHYSRDLNGMKSLARVVQGKPLGPQAVLIKGAHLHMISKHQNPERGDALVPMIVDLLFDGTEFTIIESDPPSHPGYIRGKVSSLNSAISANIASGRLLQTAVLEAYQYIEAGIKADFAIGHDSHTINHFHTLHIQPFSSGHFIDYLIQRRDMNPLWNAFTQHKFVRAIGDGSLPLDVFKRFLVQDYLYLTQFARTNALAAYKSNDMEEIAASAQIVLGVQKEMALHLEYCQDFGISKQEMEATQESQATVAYSRYVLDVGQSGDWLGLQIAMASCLVGYQTAAEWVKAQPGSKRENNRYWKWVDNYGGEEYAEGVRLGREMIEKHASKISPQRVEELVRIFIRVTEMEINFWEFDAHLK